MEANELRICNLVYVTSGVTEIASILSISKNRLEYETETRKGEAVINCFKPIPLTEEWLINLGFIKKLWKAKNVNYYELNGFEIILKDTYYKKGATYFKSSLLFEYFPEYVHQLQNLYFALTNNELDYETK